MRFWGLFRAGCAVQPMDARAPARRQIGLPAALPPLCQCCNHVEKPAAASVGGGVTTRALGLAGGLRNHNVLLSGRRLSNNRRPGYLSSTRVLRHRSLHPQRRMQ
jgi:hypothetical protein